MFVLLYCILLSIYVFNIELGELTELFEAEKPNISSDGDASNSTPEVYPSSLSRKHSLCIINERKSLNKAHSLPRPLPTTILHGIVTDILRSHESLCISPVNTHCKKTPCPTRFHRIGLCYFPPEPSLAHVLSV